MPRITTRDFDRAIQREQERTDRIAAGQPLIGEDEFVALAEQVEQPGSRARFIQDFVAGRLPTRDETQTTPAPRRHSPERDASSGGKGAGDGQHLSLVGGRVIDATDRFDARRRNHFSNGSAA